MDDRDVFDELLAEELEAGMTRADVLKRGAAAGAGIYGLSALFGAGTALAGMQARSLTPTFYQWIYGLYPDIPSQDQQGLREEAQARREDRAGAGLRHRPLRRRGEEEEEHVGRVRRHDAVRRDGRPDRVGHDRAVGQVHPEVGAHRPDPVDPAGGDLQGPHLVVPVPARHHHPGLERRARQEGRPRPEQGAEDLGRVHREREEGRQLEGGAVRCRVRRARLALARADRAHVHHERLHAGRAVRLHAATRS